VVDDEKDLCMLLDKLLSGEGHKVKTVGNGAEANDRYNHRLGREA